MYPGALYCASYLPLGLGLQGTIEIVLTEALLGEVVLNSLMGMGRTYEIDEALIVHASVRATVMYTYTGGEPPVGLTQVDSGGPFIKTGVGSPELEYFVESEGLTPRDVEEPPQDEHSVDDPDILRTVD